MSQYSTGTVTVTQGNASIVGTGTAWLENVTAGSIFTLPGTGVPYVVGNVVDDTHITLASNYAGANASSTSYSLTTSYTPNLSIPYPEQGDVDTATILKRAMLVIDQNVTGPAPTINATSTSNVAIGTGNKTFITQTGKQFAYPQYLTAADAANAAKYVAGQVVSYNAVDGTLVLNSTAVGGSGNSANWAISLSGAPGGTGSPGNAATISVGNTTTLSPGSNASVTNSGNSSAAVFNFNIPAGAAATISVGTTTTGNAGSNASVTNSGSNSAAVFNFTIPRGDRGLTGDPGPQGPAATVTVGNVTTLAPGSNATVTNTGNSTAAVFDFALPAGANGLGTGTVTSVGLSMPNLFSVANSPITGSGTFGVTLNTQNANTIFAGPTSGNASVPTFRTLTAADQGTLFNANGATIAIGGAVTFTGTYTTNFNVTGNSNVTLPATGTLTTLAGNESLSNKTLAAPVVSGYTETVNAPAANSSFTVDLTKTVSAFTTNANTTITIPAPVAGKSFQLQINFGGAHTIGFTVTGGTTVGGATYTPTSTSSKSDILNFTTLTKGDGSLQWVMSVFAQGV